MMPTVEAMFAVANAINAQHPSLAGAPASANETAGTRSCVLTLTERQIITLVSALGVATGFAQRERAWATTSPAQTAWAGIIDVALTARGAPPHEMRNEAFAALTRVDVQTLERMAALVLGETTRVEGRVPLVMPDTPESVAKKADDARAALDAFRRAGSLGKSDEGGT